MKKFEALGRSLSKGEQKKIKGGIGETNVCQKVCTTSGHQYATLTDEVCDTRDDCSVPFTCEPGYTASYSCV